MLMRNAHCKHAKQFALIRVKPQRRTTEESVAGLITVAMEREQSTNWSVDEVFTHTSSNGPHVRSCTTAGFHLTPRIYFQFFVISLLIGKFYGFINCQVL